MSVRDASDVLTVSTSSLRPVSPVADADSPPRAGEAPRSRRIAAFAAVWLALMMTAAAPAAEGQPQSKLWTLRGRTMGTTYMVKLFDPPEQLDRQQIALAVDAELRQVNDQMSTYLESSEISRFNASSSTDWFSVSAETAEVVDFALAVSHASDGAFDVTVGPLVNAWSFGPEPRSRTVPEPSELERLRQAVGHEKLAVRLDPPALRKTVPELQVDLSAIAKGHGVDRVVERLNDRGAENVFVEIGGEVRTAGDKGGKPWKVGIQRPDEARNAVLIAHPLSGRSMATSGDYRNYFEVGGRRYSHTLDPRTAKPIDHSLASVSVVTDTCMAADAWATAINVLGMNEGLKLAREQNLDALLIGREGDGYTVHGTGSLAQYATSSEPSDDEASAMENLWPIALLTLVAFGVVLAAMAVGVMFGRRAISGSCGGLANRKNEDGTTSCSLCSNPSDGCKDLQDRMQPEASADPAGAGHSADSSDRAGHSHAAS